MTLAKRLKDAATMGPEYAESVRRYLSSIGTKGGKAGVGKAKARTKAQARRAARARWDKDKAKA